MNLDKAIKLEEDYLKIVNSKNADKFYFKEKMELLGFKDLEEYNKLKEEHLFKKINLQVRETTPNTIVEETKNVIEKGEEVAFIISQKENWCFYGIDEANKQYVLDHNIKFLDLKYQGGTIISTPKDLEMVIIIKKHGLNSFFRNNFNRLLNEMGVINNSNGNDLLIHSDLYIDDFKICGFAEKDLGNEYSIYYVQVSFEINLDLINAICITDSKKVPRGINDFYPNKNRSELVELIKKWLL